MRTPHLAPTLVCLCLSISQSSFAQRGLFWLGGFELGGNTGSYNFIQNKNILVNGYEDGDNDNDGTRSGDHFSGNTSLYYRFSRRLGIEAGLTKTSVDFPLKDVRFQSTHKISDADFNSQGNFYPNASYNAKYIAAHYYFKDHYSLGAQLFFGGGIAFNNINLKSSSAKKSYFDQASNENLFLNGSFTQNYFSPFIETGIFFYSPHKKFRSFFSLKYSFGPTLFSGDYQCTQNGNDLYQDHVTANGSSFTLSYKFGLSLIKPKDQLYTHHFSTRHYRTIRSTKLTVRQKTERDVLKTDLLGCYGYDKHSKVSFWLYENKNQYFLEKLDSNLSRVFVEKLNLKSDESGLGKHDWVFVKDMMVKEKITLFTTSGNAESTYIKITAHQFALNGRESRNSLNVFQLKGNEKSYIHIVWSSDSGKVSVVLFKPKSKSKLNDTNRLMIKTFDHNLNLLNTSNIDLPSIDKKNSDGIYLSEIKQNNRGELFMTAVQYKKNNATRNFSIWAYNPETKRISEVKFDIKNISSLQFRNYQDEIYTLGFYNELGKNTDLSPYKGIFYGKINASQLKVEDVKLSELPRDFAQTSVRGRLHYKFVSIINHKGGAILSAEDLSLPKPPILTLASIDNDGNLKSISTVKSHSFGYFPWFNEHNNSLSIIFNQRTKNIVRENLSNDLNLKLREMEKRRKTAAVLITIDALGNQTKRLLLPNDSTKTRWIPGLSFPIDSNKILLVGKLSGKYKRIMVKDTSK